MLFIILAVRTITLNIRNGYAGTDLIAIDHEMMRSDEGFEDDYPAGVGGPLEQRVSQLRNVHVHLVSTVDEI